MCHAHALVHEWVYTLYIGLVISGSLNLRLLPDGLIGMPSHVVSVRGVLRPHVDICVSASLLGVSPKTVKL